MKQYKYELTYNDLGLSEVLSINPAGARELGIVFSRNETYNSVLRSFVLSLRFPRKPGGGGTNIENSYFLKGISASVDVSISELDPDTNTYLVIYTGILDFNPDRFTRQKDFIEIGLIDSDKLQKFKARDDINFDVNSTTSADDVAVAAFSNTPRSIIFKPIDILLSVEQICRVQIDRVIFTAPQIATLVPYEFYYYALSIGLNESGDRLRTDTGLTGATSVIYRNSTDYLTEILFTDVAVLGDTALVDFYDIRLSTSETAAALVQAELKMLVKNDDEQLGETIIFSRTIRFEKNSGDPIYATPDRVYINFDLSSIRSRGFLVPSGGTMEFILTIYPTALDSWKAMRAEVFGALRNNINFIENVLSVNQTPADSFLPYEAFTRLIQLSTSETDTSKLLYSNFFGRTDSEFQTYGVNGQGALDAISSIWNIRQFPNRAFNLNIKTLFQTFDAIYALGMGYDKINDRFYIEPIENFYKSSYLMFDLGEVAEFTIKPYKEAFASKILSGYDEKGDYEDLKGVNEYNVQNEHSMVLPVVDSVEYRGVYNTDSLTPELARRKQYVNYASEDTRYDDKIVIVRTDGTTTIVNGTTATGFKGVEQYYNIALSPRENLIRQAGRIKAALWLHDLKVKFVKSSKSTNLSYRNQHGTTVNEFDDLTAADLQKSQLFIPEVYEFESKITPAILAALNTDPHGFIRFSFNGTDYEGYLLNLESGYQDRKAKYKLVAKEISEGDNFIFEDGNNFVFEDGNNFIFE